MPTIPKIQKLSANGVDILNVIRQSASSTYQDRIPVATQENIRDIGKAMLENENSQNEFLYALVNRIAKVIINTKSYTNPLKRFKKGMLEYGETIEEIFVNIAMAHKFDPAVAEKNLFKREMPDVQAVFHKRNYDNFWKVTISIAQLTAAFLSSEGISELVAYIVDSLYTGAEFDEFLIMKELIANAANEGRMIPIQVPAPTPENAKAIVTVIKATSNSLEFMSTKYNDMGVLTYSKKEDQILLVDAQFDAVIDIEVLASAFNMNKAEFLGQRVLIDNFSTLTGVVAALVDASWFQVYDTFQAFKETENGEGLYWNYVYHKWNIFSTSPFATAILFTSEPVAVSGITISPATATLPKGQSLQLTATVTGTGFVPTGIYWSVEGEETLATINQRGVLHVPNTEPNDELKVIATSMYDDSKVAIATITLI